MCASRVESPWRPKAGASGGARDRESPARRGPGTWGVGRLDEAAEGLQPCLFAWGIPAFASSGRSSYLASALVG